jgi:hypothetical protein
MTSLLGIAVAFIGCLPLSTAGPEVVTICRAGLLRSDNA